MRTGFERCCSYLPSLKYYILWILEQCLSLLLDSLYIVESRVRKNPVGASLLNGVWKILLVGGVCVIFLLFFQVLSWLNLQTANKCAKHYKIIINT